MKKLGTPTGADPGTENENGELEPVVTPLAVVGELVVWAADVVLEALEVVV